MPPIGSAVGQSSSAETPQVVGARGPLSSSQVNDLVARMTTGPSDDILLSHHIAVEQAVAETPLFTGQIVHLLRDGPETFRATFAAIRSAKHEINLEYFIFEDVQSDGAQLGDLLIAKRKEGVAINLIYDGLGSFNTPSAFFDRLRKAGVKVVEYNPLDPLKAKAPYSLNDRDHRKILVIDGATAIIGGVNLDVSYQIGPDGKSKDITGKPTDRMRDTDLEIEGPAVAQLQALFLEHWRAQHGPPLKDDRLFPALSHEGQAVVRIIGSSPASAVPRYYVTLISQIRSAEKSITICAAFFVPTHDEVEALKQAARRGVAVRLLLPDHGNSELSIAVGHSHYGELLRAGVTIYETHGVVLHSKTVTIDGVWSVIGSSNFDRRSVIFNDEVDAVVLGRDTARALEALFEDDRNGAGAIDRATWRRRPLTARLHEVYARLWQEWL